MGQMRLSARTTVSPPMPESKIPMVSGRGQTGGFLK